MIIDTIKHKLAPPPKAQQPAESQSLNYRFVRFFLTNSRLTLLALLLLLTVGVASTLSLKTTGFPNINIAVVQVQTTYPGAGAQTVAQDVTVPIEGKIKNIPGIQSYSSRTSNSFSAVSLSLNPGASPDTVSSQVSAALQGLVLPTGVQTPTVSSLKITSPTFRVSIAGTDLAKVYGVEQKVKRDLGQNQSTASVTAVDELSPRVTVVADPAKLAAAHLSMSDVQAALKTVGLTLPVASNLSIGGYSQSLSTRLGGTSLADIQALPLRPAPAPLAPAISLSQVAAVTLTYAFASATEPVLGYNSGGDHGTLPAVTLVITAADNTDIGAYTQQVRSLLGGYSEAQYVRGDPVLSNGTVQIVEQASADDSNQRQVKEVKGGLIGGPLPVSNHSLAQLGWLLGGIQLVFLAMMALVSWRAAVVSSLAIPLSLLFSSIYLKATGNSFNTIVLFSLVLAIGLVVDPALVVLEAVQRKIDVGMRGNRAVLEAVKDVGSGLFIATLNNIIVFAPFGVVSGGIGQIFSNIPASIIPAIIGSYVVPLLFLAWLGGLVLRPGKRTSTNEEENLWPFAGWLIRFNQKVLDGSVLRRVVMIGIAAAVPLAIAGFYFATGRITLTQFSGSATGTTVDISGTFRSDLTKERRQADTDQILGSISANPHLGTIYATGTGFTYSAYLKSGDTYPIGSLQSDISAELNQFSDDFFTVRATVESITGPPTQYQVQISVTSDDPAVLERSAKAVGGMIAAACLESDKTVDFPASCAGTQLAAFVNDGYTGQENRSIEVLLDRSKLAHYGLDPQGAQISGILSQLFPSDQAPQVATAAIGGNQVAIYLRTDLAQPKTVADLQALPLTPPQGSPITLGDVATISQTSGSSSITRDKGQTVALVQARLAAGHDDQATAAKLTSAVVARYAADGGSAATSLGLEKGAVTSYSGGGSADFGKSFTQLLEALALAIFATYAILVVFFNSFLQPLVVLFTIPLTFIGIFPALAYLGSRQFGFFEVIGMIILVGLVDNVAIFLIDAARQRITAGMDPKTAVAHASGIRLRPVILTKIVALASLAPLAVLSPFYRSISLVIMFGLLTSGLTSLFTTPILFIFFGWLSEEFGKLSPWRKVVFILLSIPYLLVLGWRYRKSKRAR